MTTEQKSIAQLADEATPPEVRAWLASKDGEGALWWALFVMDGAENPKRAAEAISAYFAGPMKP